MNGGLEYECLYFYGNKLDENSKSSKLVHNLESHLNSNEKN